MKKSDEKITKEVLAYAEQYEKKSKILKISLIVFLVFLVFLFIGGYIYLKNLDVEILKSCEVDSDCIPVSADCCTCNNGGENMAINGKFLPVYNSFLGVNCQSFDCDIAVSDDLTCFAEARCVENKCSLKVGEVEACENSDDPDWCYFIFARKNNEPSLCGEISSLNFNMKEVCEKTVG